LEHRATPRCGTFLPPPGATAINLGHCAVSLDTSLE